MMIPNSHGATLPSLLITTSRRTSNRVRSFVRDLSTVLTGSERFNRGSMNQDELIARINQSEARAAIVVTMRKGNPSNLNMIGPSGDIILTVEMESAALRREVLKNEGPRIVRIDTIASKTGSSEFTLLLSRTVASLLGLESQELEKQPDPSPKGKNAVVLWFENISSEKVLWTHYHANDGVEIGPRIRVVDVTKSSHNL
ncbi:MAG: Brix domain-containing protein [Candidatus Thorarchaeota archaeon]